MHTVDKPKKLSKPASWQHRLDEEMANHSEDEQYHRQITGNPHTLDASVPDLHALDQSIRRKRRLGWIILVLVAAHHLVWSLGQEFVPLFVTPVYIISSGVIEAGLVGIVVLYFFTSLTSNLFRD